MSREDFKGRNITEARRRAHAIVEHLIASYLDVGQPYEDADDDVPVTDQNRLCAALEKIRDYHHTRS